MSNLDKIRGKIAALLKKTEASGATEAEAATAMGIAAKLMSEHGVTMADIKENNEASRDFTKHKANGNAKNLSVVDKFVATAIAAYTDTKVWSSKEFDGFKTGLKNKEPKYKSSIMFYGYSVDVELACYIYKICDSAVESEWKKFSTRLPTGHRGAARISFQLGMALRLRDRLIDLKGVNVKETNGRDLIVLKKQLVETSFNQEVSLNTKKSNNQGVKFRRGDAFEAGKDAGDRVKFNRAVHDGPVGGVKLIA